jgi:hypothetical protein
LNNSGPIDPKEIFLPTTPKQVNAMFLNCRIYRKVFFVHFYCKSWHQCRSVEVLRFNLTIWIGNLRGIEKARYRDNPQLKIGKKYFMDTFYMSPALM